MSTRFSLYCLCIACMGLMLTGCHSVSGNVIPQGGPSMENVYDSMSVAGDPQETATEVADEKNAKNSSEKTMAENDLSDIRQKASLNVSNTFSATPKITSTNTTFHKLPNPELTLYIYPHLAGTDEIPIPGYQTAFNAYDKTYYALPSEMPH